MLLPPFYENIGKRVIKSPKLYFTDVGLASYLLGIHTLPQIERDPLRGQLFENMVVMELYKYMLNRGSAQNEIDLIYKMGNK